VDARFSLAEEFEDRECVAFDRRLEVHVGDDLADLEIAAVGAVSFGVDGVVIVIVTVLVAMAVIVVFMAIVVPVAVTMAMVVTVLVIVTRVTLVVVRLVVVVSVRVAVRQEHVDRRRGDAAFVDGVDLIFDLEGVGYGR